MADFQSYGCYEEKWSCTECTLLNELSSLSCEVCGATSPLVLQNYHYEEKMAASTHARNAPTSTSSQASSSPKYERTALHESFSSTNERDYSEQIAAELDPWAQAEEEWSHVESYQEQRQGDMRRRK